VNARDSSGGPRGAGSLPEGDYVRRHARNRQSRPHVDATEFRGYAYNMIALRTPSNFHLTAAKWKVRSAAHPGPRRAQHRRADDLAAPSRLHALERPYLVKSWTDTTNEVIAQQCDLLPDRFVGVAQLPQTPLEDTSNSADVLERCVNEYGFVAADVNPDPGGDGATPG